MINKIQKAITSALEEQWIYGHTDSFFEMTKNKKGEVIDIKHIPIEDVEIELKKYGGK